MIKLPCEDCRCFLAHCNEEAQRHLIRHAHRINYPLESLIFEQGSPVVCAYVICQGGGFIRSCGGGAEAECSVSLPIMNYLLSLRS